MTDLSTLKLDEGSPAEGNRWELYRLLGEPVRLKLLALAAREELSVGELAEVLDENQPNISRHVAALRRATLLEVRKEATRVLARLRAGVTADPFVSDALDTGLALAAEDGSLERLARVIRAREEASRAFFDGEEESDAPPAALPSELPAYLSALALLIPSRALAVDVGTGDGGLLDVLAPVYERVIAIDRSGAQLRRAKKRLEARGYSGVTLLRAELGDTSVRGEVQRAGGADAVFACRVLHHAARPAETMRALAALAKPGGAVVVLDYDAHHDETMRERQADLWLGFPQGELRSLAEGAGLDCEGPRTIPSTRCGDGADGHLDWQVLVARKRG